MDDTRQVNTSRTRYAGSIEAASVPRRILAPRLAKRWDITTGALAKRRQRGAPPLRWFHVSRTAVAYDLDEVEELERAGASPNLKDVQP